MTSTSRDGFGIGAWRCADGKNTRRHSQEATGIPAAVDKIEGRSRFSVETIGARRRQLDHLAILVEPPHEQAAQARVVFDDEEVHLAGYGRLWTNAESG
jgi:hypothetical protein